MPFTLVPDLNSPGDVNLESIVVVSRTIWGVSPFFNLMTGEMEINGNGDPVLTTVEDDPIHWVRKALATAQNRWRIYIYSDYGNHLINNIGRSTMDGILISEAEKYIKDSLSYDPRISKVSNIQITFNADMLYVNFFITFQSGKRYQYKGSWNYQ